MVLSRARINYSEQLQGTISKRQNAVRMVPLGSSSNIQTVHVNKTVVLYLAANRQPMAPRRIKSWFQEWVPGTSENYLGAQAGKFAFCQSVYGFFFCKKRDYLDGSTGQFVQVLSQSRVPFALKLIFEWPISTCLFCHLETKFSSGD